MTNSSSSSIGLAFKKGKHQTWLVFSKNIPVLSSYLCWAIKLSSCLMLPALLPSSIISKYQQRERSLKSELFSLFSLDLSLVSYQLICTALRIKSKLFNIPCKCPNNLVSEYFSSSSTFILTYLLPSHPHLCSSYSGFSLSLSLLFQKHVHVILN